MSETLVDWLNNMTGTLMGMENIAKEKKKEKVYLPTMEEKELVEGAMILDTFGFMGIVKMSKSDSDRRWCHY